MIRLTRLGRTEPFFLNPDHIERLNHHHDTNIKMSNGTVYVVSEAPEEIVERVIMQRAQIMALASHLMKEWFDGGDHGIGGRAMIPPSTLGHAAAVDWEEPPWQP